MIKHFSVDNEIMNVDERWKCRVLLISIWLLSIWNGSVYGWHQTLTFTHQLTYNISEQNSFLSSDMKFFMWYDSYAIYGAREKLILLKPILNTSAVCSTE